MPQEKYYLLRFAFRGDSYAGWQRQVSALSVQQVMEDCLRRILEDSRLCLTGCSRTDAGVHAREMCASFRTANVFDAQEVMKSLSVQLPHDIRVISMEEKEPGFNAHSDVQGRAYVYAVYTGEYALYLKGLCQSWNDVSPDFDRESLRRTVSMICGAHDFRNFTGKRKNAGSFIRTIRRAEIYAFGRVLCFYLSGDGFLYQMIRRLAAQWHEIAAGRLSAEAFEQMLDGPEQPVNDAAAPSCGLYLKKVFYQPDEWKTDTLNYPPFYF